jgi:hypothetical protein
MTAEAGPSQLKHKKAKRLPKHVHNQAKIRRVTEKQKIELLEREALDFVGG